MNPSEDFHALDDTVSINSDFLDRLAKISEKRKQTDDKDHINRLLEHIKSTRNDLLYLYDATHPDHKISLIFQAQLHSPKEDEPSIIILDRSDPSDSPNPIGRMKHRIRDVPLARFTENPQEARPAIYQDDKISIVSICSRAHTFSIAVYDPWGNEYQIGLYLAAGILYSLQILYPDLLKDTIYQSFTYHLQHHRKLRYEFHRIKTLFYSDYPSIEKITIMIEDAINEYDEELVEEATSEFEELTDDDDDEDPPTGRTPALR